MSSQDGSEFIPRAVTTDNRQPAFPTNSFFNDDECSTLAHGINITIEEAPSLRRPDFGEDPPSFPKKLESNSVKEPDFKKAKDSEKAFWKLSQKFDELSQFAQDVHFALVNTRELAEEYIERAQPDLVKKQKEITANGIKMTELRMQLENAKKNSAEMTRQIKNLEGNLKSRKDDADVSLLGEIKQQKQTVSDLRKMLSEKETTYKNIERTHKDR